MLIKKFVSIIAVLLLAACTGQPVKQDFTVGSIIVYDEQQPEGEPYETRMFANAEYLFITDSLTPDNYILFNRKEQTIYNVVAEDKSIMVITKQPVTAVPPTAIDYQVEEQPSMGIPKLDGKQATHYRIKVNGEICYNVVSLAGILDEATKAMREYREVLAGEHAKSVDQIPQDMIDACDLAMNVFHAADHLDKGFPLREWDSNGFTRFLNSYSESIRVENERLSLPEDYSRYTLEREQ